MGNNKSKTFATLPSNGLSVAGTTWHITCPMAATKRFLALLCNIGFFCIATYSCILRSANKKETASSPFFANSLVNMERWLFVIFFARQRFHCFFVVALFAVVASTVVVFVCAGLLFFIVDFFRGDDRCCFFCDLVLLLGDCCSSSVLSSFEAADTLFFFRDLVLLLGECRCVLFEESASSFFEAGDA